MRATVTGGAGFIGSHLVRGLVDRGDDVVVVDDFSSGDLQRLAPFGGAINLVEGSVLDPAVLDRALAGSDVVFHLAAIASVARSIVDPRGTDNVNVGGTIEVALAAARHGVQRVVLASSSAVYGATGSLPCTERQRPDPLSPYGASKAAAELYLHALGGLLGVETVALRYFNVYGPNQDPASEYAAVVPRFITALLDGQRPVINGSGEISRDFVFIDDVVTANLLAAQLPSPSSLTVNVASGTRTSLTELVAATCAAVGRDVDPVIGPARAGDILHSRADVSLARDMLGFTPSASIDDGIARTVAWFREHPAGATARQAPG